MTEAAMDPELRAFIDGVRNPVRRRDAETMLGIMARATGQPAKLWGSIVGFGSYHYRYDSGREGDTAAAGFAPRAAATTVYLVDGVSAHPELLARLGPHTTGKGCLYLKDLEKVDLDVLEELIGTSYAKLTRGTWTKHARDGRPDD